MLENIEVIVFDWDGTLVDSVGPKIEQNRQLAEFFGNPLTNEEVRQYWAQARDYQELMQMLCPGVDMSEIQAEVDNQYNNPEFRKKRMGFNANYLIHTLSSHDDIKTAIATSIPRELFVRDANSLGIRIELSESESGLSFTQTSDETDFKKPDGNFFKPTLKFFREVGITAEKIMYTLQHDYANRTILMITHDLIQPAWPDRVLRLENGRLRELQIKTPSGT